MNKAAALDLLRERLDMSPAAFDAMMADMVTDFKKRQTADERAQYRTPAGIVRFVREVIGAKPTAYQARVLSAVVKHKRVAVRAPHGAGKSTLAAWFVLWLLYCFDDVKVPTLASAWRQNEFMLWPEIRKWSRRITWGADRPRVLNLKISGGDRQAFAVASDDPAMIEGVHADVVGYIFDESKAIPASFWEAAEGAFSGAGHDTAQDAYWLAISTPGEPSGVFYDIHARKRGYQDWHVEAITLRECIQAGRIAAQWVRQRIAQWGVKSSVFQNRVAGKFASSDEDSVIPLHWIERAVERWHAARGLGDGTTAWGVDPARYGTDKTAICRKVGDVIEELLYRAKDDTMQTAGRVAAMVGKSQPVAVDVVGLGAGVVDRLCEQEYNVEGVNASAKAAYSNGKPIKDATGTFTFVNMRAALWWQLRDALDPAKGATLALPDDDALIGDLTAPTYKYTSTGAIQIESKDDIRKRLKRSTDAADAVALAIWASRTRADRHRTGMMQGFAAFDGRDRAMLSGGMTRRVREMPDGDGIFDFKRKRFLD